MALCDDNTCFAPASSVPPVCSYDEVLARVSTLESNAGLLQDLSKRHASVGDLIPLIDDLCNTQKTLLDAVATLQGEMQTVLNCNKGPKIISVVSS